MPGTKQGHDVRICEAVRASLKTICPKVWKNASFLKTGSTQTSLVNVVPGTYAPCCTLQGAIYVVDPPVMCFYMRGDSLKKRPERL